MESRLEKNKRIKKHRRITFLKALVILSTFFLLYYGVKLVNDRIIYLEYIDNPTIFDLDIGEGRLELFGETYIIDLKILKKLP